MYDCTESPVLTLCLSVPGKGGVYLILQGSVEILSQDSVSKKTSSTVVSLAVYNWAVAVKLQVAWLHLTVASRWEFRSTGEQWAPNEIKVLWSPILCKYQVKMKFISLCIATLCLSRVRHVCYWGSLYLTIREYSRLVWVTTILIPRLFWWCRGEPWNEAKIQQMEWFLL